MKSIERNTCGVTFLRFWTKRRHIFFAVFLFGGLKILPPKKLFVLQEATDELLNNYFT